MGSIETILFWKFVVPLAAKIFFGGEGTPIEAAGKAIAEINSIKAGLKKADQVLLAADDEQTESIIDGLFGLATGVVGAPVILITAFLSLLRGKKSE